MSEEKPKRGGKAISPYIERTKFFPTTPLKLRKKLLKQCVDYRQKYSDEWEIKSENVCAICFPHPRVPRDDILTRFAEKEIERFRRAKQVIKNFAKDNKLSDETTNRIMFNLEKIDDILTRRGMLKPSNTKLATAIEITKTKIPLEEIVEWFKSRHKKEVSVSRVRYFIADMRKWGVKV